MVFFLCKNVLFSNSFKIIPSSCLINTICILGYFRVCSIANFDQQETIDIYTHEQYNLYNEHLLQTNTCFFSNKIGMLNFVKLDEYMKHIYLNSVRFECQTSISGDIIVIISIMTCTDHCDLNINYFILDRIILPELGLLYVYTAKFYMKYSFQFIYSQKPFANQP